MKQEPFQYEDGILRLRAWEQYSILAGFTTREGGVSEAPFTSLNLGLHVKDEETAVHENRRRLASRLQFPLHTWICSEQVHGSKVARTGAADAGKGVYAYEDGIPGTDGIYTDEQNVLLTSCYADCVPLYFYAPSHSFIGLAHAGWKGTVQGIALEMIRKWEAAGVQAGDIHVAIGPAIGACCYVVDDRVLDAAKQVVEEVPYRQLSPGQYALDLKELNALICKQAGVHEILVSSRCTSCESMFFSHRRDRGQTGRMLSFIGFKEAGQ
ncbi:peptidoglycan editing factor PgeF [Ectobacillus ponti]|uniref:Purine nucleoside phosphorylase n=1 Tax=Ectobacillus ponti TaxID=2961894 RepID=A0AA41XAN8_9BACI|nr:peptidoglycan editing factor PgeF [Ectobacillus ponti]MCP8970233.1 peptidoglycan editing factor PgeF [Ectobacillus ponti]